MDRNLLRCYPARCVVLVALRKESVDRNILSPRSAPCEAPSLSARRAWIEIMIHYAKKKSTRQSLSARRAWIEMISGLHPLIASLVALRKESVDRNILWLFRLCRNLLSLSARRAWIEICICSRLPWFLSVALRKESVDRNKQLVNERCKLSRSLSARRAWIEIRQRD